MQYRHFFWDFDGTLYDTYGRITRAAQYALADLDLSVPYGEVYQHVKRSLHTVYLHFAQPCNITEDTFMKAYRSHSETEGPESMSLYPGSRAFLEKVIALGGRNYLYTHRGYDSAFAALNRDGITPLFHDFVTSKDGFPSKPAPDALLHLTGKHSLPMPACIMMGDRDIDLEAAKNAGMAACLFDPDHFYDNYQTPLRFYTYGDMQAHFF
ncbi:MAG: HAD-IA family hydrolase [Clostridia bacterium]|nr:HAD-IA family hydrolase [Clostridia bacterium]